MDNITSINTGPAPSPEHQCIHSGPPSGDGGKHITFTVTTDLTYDQRMIRICTSLAAAGYAITLVGRKLQSSIPLKNNHSSN